MSPARARETVERSRVRPAMAGPDPDPAGCYAGRVVTELPAPALSAPFPG